MAEQDLSVVERMRADWNSRAREDANYYVAFGRRDQEDSEFQSTASNVVQGVESELKRLPAGVATRARRCLEIGCGPGRLLMPMSKHFGEIHGVDISDEMVARARERLADIPHAHAHVAQNSNLEMFADSSFDFVYSYAVFQHIPSRDVVLGYLREAFRVLKPGGVVRCQLNGLPQSAKTYDTWSGVRIEAGEFTRFCGETGFQLLELAGAGTQYMWTTLRKPDASQEANAEKPKEAVRVRRITNAESSEPLAPARGRFAALALWIDHLPEGCHLLNLEVRVGGEPGRLTYVGPRERDGLTQVNLRLPAEVRTGLQPVEIYLDGQPLGTASTVRIVPPPPMVPRVLSVTDGINLLSGTHVETRTLKVTLEELARPEEFSAWVDGQPLLDADIFCTDPLPPRLEVNLRLPDTLAAGPHWLEMRLGRRMVAPIGIEVAG